MPEKYFSGGINRMNRKKIKLVKAICVWEKLHSLIAWLKNYFAHNIYNFTTTRYSLTLDHEHDYIFRCKIKEMRVKITNKKI